MGNKIDYCCSYKSNFVIRKQDTLKFGEETVGPQDSQELTKPFPLKIKQQPAEEQNNKPTTKNNFLSSKIKEISANKDRRKSFSIAMNSQNKREKYVRQKSRSNSSFTKVVPVDLSNYQMKKPYKKLPIQNLNNTQIGLTKSISLVSNDDVQGNQSPDHRKRSTIEHINSPLTEKQLTFLKNILVQEELINEEMDEEVM